MPGARAVKPGGAGSPPTPGGIGVANAGVPVAGGPFTELDALGGTFADEGGGIASYTPPPVGRFPASGPCINVGQPGSGWVKSRFGATTLNAAYSAYSPTLGLFVMVGETSGLVVQVWTSPDGATWTNHAAPAGLNNVVALTWADGLALFVAVAFVSINGATGVTTNASYTSPDGVTWTLAGTFTNTPPAPPPPTPGETLHAMVWSPALSLLCLVGEIAITATGDSRGEIFTSPDGVTWTQQLPVKAVGLRAVAWSPSLGLFAAAGSTDPLGVTTDGVFTSPDGVTWTARATPAQAVMPDWTSMDWSPTLARFCCVGFDPTATPGTFNVMTSPDGITWSGFNQAIGSVWRVRWCGGYQGGTFVLVNNTTARIMVSSDGHTFANDATTAITVTVGSASAITYDAVQNTIVGSTTGGAGNLFYMQGAAMPCNVYASQTIQAPQLIGLMVANGLQPAIRKSTITTTLTTADVTVLMDATGGARVVNLPTAAAGARSLFNVKKIDASVNTVTITPAGGELIDGAATLVISAQNVSVQFQSDGTAWYVL